jgi:hypothetical protein
VPCEDHDVSRGRRVHGARQLHHRQRRRMLHAVQSGELHLAMGRMRPHVSLILRSAGVTHTQSCATYMLPRSASPTTCDELRLTVHGMQWPVGPSLHMPAETAHQFIELTYLYLAIHAGHARGSDMNAHWSISVFFFFFFCVCVCAHFRAWRRCGPFLAILAADTRVYHPSLGRLLEPDVCWVHLSRAQESLPPQV